MHGTTIKKTDNGVFRIFTNLPSTQLILILLY